MKQIKTILMLAWAVAIISHVSGCKKDKKSNDRTFSVQKFKENLKINMDTSIRGYSVVIGKDGQFADSINYGFATISASSGNTTPMTMHCYINIASVTKTFTAIAAIKLLDQNSIPLNTTIEDYLPAYWNAHAQVKAITFMELLTHSGGLRQSSTSYDSLRATCSRPLGGSKSRSYANCNLALFRVLLPYINNKFDTKLNESVAVNNNTTAAFEATLTQKYMTLMQDNVFTPSGIPNASCNINAVPGPKSACFSESDPIQIDAAMGPFGGDWTEICGGGGYVLTTFQMASIMAYLSHTTTLLSADQKTVMNSNLAGWDPEDSPNTSAGRAYGKDGALQWGGPGLQTYVCRYPNGVEVAISVNSYNGVWKGLGTLALNAYEDSWID